MDFYFIHRLNEELPKLEAENVITSETSAAIRAYYQNQQEKIEKTRKEQELAQSTQKREKLPFILSVISSILIFVGIVSLIAYNWNAMGRQIKTILALFVAFVPPAAYLISNKISQVKNITPAAWVKGFFALSWALLFGAALAFITQIYKLPMQETTFLIIWLISSIIITFAMDSSLVYFCSLVLLCYYCIDAQQVVNSSAWFFYPAVLALYFYARKAPVKRTILLFEAIFLIGFVLEKMLPGLWILCYSGIAVLLLLKAQASEPGTKIRWTVFAWIFFFVYLIVLSDSGFFTSIGFKYFRNQIYYVRFAALYDYVITAVLFFGALFLCFKGKNKNYFAASFLVVVGACYLFCSFNDNAWRYISSVILYFAFYAYIYLLLKYENPCTLFAMLSLFAIFALTDINYPILHVLNLIVISGFIFYYRAKLTKSRLAFFAASALILIIENWCIAFGNSAYLMSRVHDKQYIFDLVLFFLIPAGVFAASVFGFIKKKSVPLELPVFVFLGQLILFIAFGKSFSSANAVYFDILFILLGVYALIKIFNFKDVTAYALLGLSVLNCISLFSYISKVPPLFIYLYVFLLLLALCAYSCAASIEIPALQDFNNVLPWFCSAAMLVPLHMPRLFILNVQGMVRAQSLAVYIICSLYLLAVTLVIPVIRLIRTKQYKNLVFPLYAIVLLVPAVLSFFNIRAPQTFDLICLGFMIAYGVAGIFVSFRAKSVANTNFFTVFVCYVLIVKFFQFDTGLVERGIVFILCGIAILIVNKLISKQGAKNEEQN